MTDLSSELEGLYLLYGTSIPPLPRRPSTAWVKVAWDTQLDRFAQRAANVREYGYDGDVGALIRHATSLLLMTLAKSSRMDVSPVRFQMEIQRRQAEEEEYAAFVTFAQATIREAEEYAGTMVGRGPAVHRLRSVKAALTTHPSPAVRLRMQAYLTGHADFVKLVKSLGDEGLKAWLELAS